MAADQDQMPAIFRQLPPTPTFVNNLLDVGETWPTWKQRIAALESAPGAPPSVTITEIKTDLSTIRTQVSEFQQWRAAILTSLSGMDSRIGTNSRRIDGVVADLATLQGQVAALPGAGTAINLTDYLKITDLDSEAGKLGYLKAIPAHTHPASDISGLPSAAAAPYIDGRAKLDSEMQSLTYLKRSQIEQLIQTSAAATTPGAPAAPFSNWKLEQINDTVAMYLSMAAAVGKPISVPASESRVFLSPPDRLLDKLRQLLQMPDEVTELSKDQWIDFYQKAVEKTDVSEILSRISGIEGKIKGPSGGEGPPAVPGAGWGVTWLQNADIDSYLIGLLATTQGTTQKKWKTLLDYANKTPTAFENDILAAAKVQSSQLITEKIGQITTGKVTFSLSEIATPDQVIQYINTPLNNRINGALRGWENTGEIQALIQKYAPKPSQADLDTLGYRKGVDIPTKDQFDRIKFALEDPAFDNLLKNSDFLNSIGAFDRFSTIVAATPGVKDIGSDLSKIKLLKTQIKTPLTTLKNQLNTIKLYFPSKELADKNKQDTLTGTPGTDEVGLVSNLIEASKHFHKAADQFFTTGDLASGATQSFKGMRDAGDAFDYLDSIMRRYDNMFTNLYMIGQKLGDISDQLGVIIDMLGE